MSKIIEVTHVSLGGEIDLADGWAMPFLDDDHWNYNSELLSGADSLLLGRHTYQGLSAAYPAMEPSPFINRMNAIPKHVASRTLHETDWNATVIDGDVVDFVTNLRKQPGNNVLKYGNGPLSAQLMRHGLIDEFHFFLTPIAMSKSQRLFEDLDGTPALDLVSTHRFASGVLAVVYTPTSDGN